ncbi:MAG: hypothetical protein Q7S86_05140 [bacterium]|nr:hypothetical protein [bacterium]
MSGEERFFTTRHARPERNKTSEDPASKEYPDLTVVGVEQAKERAQGDILQLIKEAPKGAVVFIAATSDQPRTKQTAEIYGDGLSAIQEEIGNDVIVLTKRQIEGMSTVPAGGSGVNGFSPRAIAIAEVVRKIDEIIKTNPDKKVVIDYPLMVKQLAYKYNNRWTDQAGKKTEYFSEVLKKHNNSHEEAGKDWIANQGRLELPDGRVLQGPAPAQVAAEYLEGARRLRDFAKKYVGDRPLIIGEVGHQWDLDALVTSLANGGKVDLESFNRVTGGGIAGETEIVEFTIGDKKTVVKYRGKEFSL